MTRLNTFLLITLAGAALGSMLAILAGCGSDNACEAGLEMVAPGVCKVPGGSTAGSGGSTMRTGSQTGQPGGIVPPSSFAGIGAVTGGRSGGSAGGQSGGTAGGASGGQVATGGAGATSPKPTGGDGTGGRVVAMQGGSGGAGHGASGGGGSGGEPDEPMSQPPVGGQTPPVMTPPKGGMMAPSPPPVTPPPPPPPPAPSHFCGDGTIDSGESCDGDCPTTCDDGDPCTKDASTGSPNLCNLKCSHSPASAGTDCGNGKQCNANSECAEVVPSGWTWVTKGGSCGGAIEFHAKPSATCAESCSCGAPGVGTCIGRGTATFTDGSRVQTTIDQPGLSCVPFDGSSKSNNEFASNVTIEGLTWTAAGGPGCGPSGSSSPDVKWADSVTLCEQDTAASCVYRDGQQSCPSGYGKAETWYSSADMGGVSCSCGGCSAAPGSCANAGYAFGYGRCPYESFSLPSNGGTLFKTPDGDQIVVAELYPSVKGQATSGTCSAPKASLSGSPRATGEVTVCCK
jgi:hypothetical protein